MNEPIDLAEAFERLWASGSPPNLEAFLNGSGAVDAVQLSRLARIDQAQRWQRGERRFAEEYLERFPALQADRERAVDLIYHEFLVREKLVERPSLEEFTNRFPQHASALVEQVALHRALAQASENVGNADAVGTPVGTSFETHAGQENRLQAPAAHQGPGDAPRRLGRYELLGLVGTGSFGVVYRARDPELDRVVAIKIPRDSNVSGQGEVERFLREGRSVARLRHPGIVSVHEIGRSEQTPFLVSEFVQGTTLAEMLESRRPAPREAAELVATVADALHYAHEMGVVHRDVKPANIKLDELGRPRLMDFGLARRDAGDVTMTIDGQVLGTPAYMSPEQARGEARSVDGRSDVYSLGVILYQSLTGELPFRGTARMLLHQVLHEEPRPPRSLSQEAPRDLETICLRAMSKEPTGRYATARDMADDLRRYLRGEPIHARPIGTAERAWRWCRRKPALAILIAAVGILSAAMSLGGTAVVSTLLGVIAAGGTVAAFQFRRQAQKEKSLRSEADENLYFHRIALAHRDLTANRPQPGRAEELLEACPPDRRGWEWDYMKRLWRTEPAVLRNADSQEFRGIAFSPSGNYLAAACGDGSIRVWNLRTGETFALAGHDAFVYSVTFSPVDGNRLASSGNDGRVRMWDLKSRRETLSPPLAGLQVYAVGMAHCVCFSPDGEMLAAASEGGAVQVWDASNGRLIHRLEGHELWAGCVAFSPDGRFLASGSWLGNVRVWDARTGHLLKILQLPEHRYPVACLAFSPDSSGQYLAAGYFDNRVDVWDIAKGMIHRQLWGHTGFISSLAFQPQDAKRLASAGEDRTVRIWDMPTGREVLQLQGHIDSCSGLAFSPNGRLLASASCDRTIRLWDATTRAGDQRQELHTLQRDDEARSVAISPDGTRVAAAGIGPNVQIWDTMTGREMRSFPSSFTRVVFSLAFSPDGQRIAAVGFDDGAPACVLKVLDVQTSQTVLEHREGQEIFAAEFSPDGRWLAFGLGDGSVKLADADTGNLITSVGKHDRPIAYGSVRFRHDGLRLASASLDGTVRVWDLTSALSDAHRAGGPYGPAAADHLCCRMSSGDPIIAFWSIWFSPDGRRLITGDKVGQLTLWDAETGEELDKKSEAASGAYLSAAYSPDGRWIVSASEDCTARVYDARTLEPVHRLRGHLGPIHCLAVSDDFIVTGGIDKTVRVWDLKHAEASAKSNPAAPLRS